MSAKPVEHNEYVCVCLGYEFVQLGRGVRSSIGSGESALDEVDQLHQARVPRHRFDLVHACDLATKPFARIDERLGRGTPLIDANDASAVGDRHARRVADGDRHGQPRPSGSGERDGLPRLAVLRAP